MENSSKIDYYDCRQKYPGLWKEYDKTEKHICYFLLDLIERDQYVYDTDCADISRYWFIVRDDCFSAEHVVLIYHEYHWDDDYNEVCNNYYYEYQKDIPTDLNYPLKNRDWMKI